AQTREVLIEGNYLFDNGNDGSSYEHNSYTAAVGITFQYNRYGLLRTGCLGNNLKDRSAGLVVRYNWIEGGNRQLDLVDGEDDPAIQADPRYRQTYAYGNVLVEPDGAGNRQIVHYGGDSGNTALYRKGTLYFYQNTVLSTRTDRTTLFRLSTNEEQCDCRNDILYVSAAGNTLSLLDDTGKLTLTHNWLRPGWVQSFGGTSGTLLNDGSNLGSAAPGFLYEPGQNFRLAPASVCIDAGTNLHPAVLPGYEVTQECLNPQTGGTRRTDQRLDLGSYEYSPWHAWQFAQFGPGYPGSALTADAADPDGDGVANLLEYAFGMNPNSASRSALPAASMIATNDNNYLAVRFSRRLPPSELTYTVQTSTDLVGWTDGVAWSDSGAVTSVGHTTVVSGGTNTVVRVDTPLSILPQMFLRVRVERK
ncbi:MAG TPA: hypothetical protein VNZ22_17470, partial [Bacillota bacterium]|nr:hypothetical protein [Bacillota bacterium]